jgi:cytochrome c-type biogenesis protein CcmH
MRRLAVLLAALAVLALPAAATAAPASLVDLEDEVMCVTCNVPLNIAESPQADRERAFIRSQIDRGATKEQVKRAMVAEYGSDVLALPDDGGINVLVYAVPIVLGLGLVGLLAVFVPRWRRRSDVGDTPAAPGVAALSATDAQRLDEDLARYER